MPGLRSGRKTAGEDARASQRRESPQTAGEGASTPYRSAGPQQQSSEALHKLRQPFRAPSFVGAVPHEQTPATRPSTRPAASRAQAGKGSREPVQYSLFNRAQIEANRSKLQQGMLHRRSPTPGTEGDGPVRKRARKTTGLPPIGLPIDNDNGDSGSGSEETPDAPTGLKGRRAVAEGGISLPRTPLGRDDGVETPVSLALQRNRRAATQHAPASITGMYREGEMNSGLVLGEDLVSLMPRRLLTGSMINLPPRRRRVAWNNNDDDDDEDNSGEETPALLEPRRSGRESAKRAATYITELCEQIGAKSKGKKPARKPQVASDDGQSYGEETLGSGLKLGRLTGKKNQEWLRENKVTTDTDFGPGKSKSSRSTALNTTLPTPKTPAFQDLSESGSNYEGENEDEVEGVRLSDDDFSDNEEDVDLEGDEIAGLLGPECTGDEDFANENEAEEAEPSSDSDVVIARPRRRGTKPRGQAKKLSNKVGKADSKKAPAASKATKRVRNFYRWTTDEWSKIDLGKPAAGAAEPEVDQEDLAKFDELAKHVIKVRCEQARDMSPEEDGCMTYGMRYFARSLGEKRIWEDVFANNTREVRRAILKPSFTLADFLQLPAPTDEELNRSGVYMSICVLRDRNTQLKEIGRYIGSGTAQARRKGVGQRLKDYENLKRRADSGLITADDRVGRHLRFALRKNIEWHIRLISSFPEGTLRPLPLFVEGLWVDIVQSLTSAVPPPDSRTWTYQRPAFVKASRNTVPEGFPVHNHQQLNGASPFAQGAGGIGQVAKLLVAEEQEGLCACCDGPIFDELKQPVFSKIPGIQKMLVHHNCDSYWAVSIRRGAIKSNDTSAKAYMDHRRKAQTDRVRLGVPKQLDHHWHNLELARKEEHIKNVQNCICDACGMDRSDAAIAASHRLVNGEYKLYWITHDIPGLRCKYICSLCYEYWRKSDGGTTVEEFVKKMHAVAGAQARGSPGSKRPHRQMKKVDAFEEQNYTCPFCLRHLPELATTTMDKNGKKNHDRWIKTPLPDVSDAKFACSQCHINFHYRKSTKKLDMSKQVNIDAFVRERREFGRT